MGLKVGRAELFQASSLSDWKLFKAIASRYTGSINAPDDNGDTLLHACSTGFRNSDVMRFVLSQEKLDVNARNKNGATPLHMCCTGNPINVANARLLLQNKAEVNAKDNDGQTPLHYAVANLLTQYI